MNDKLRKVRFLYDHVRECCRSLYQPRQKLSVDGRMIRQEGRTTLEQCLPKKPTKWGVKVLAVCDQEASYNMDFMIYTESVLGQDETSMT